MPAPPTRRRYRQLDNNLRRVSYVQSRWYRAPEVLLGAQVEKETLDCWSVGCVVAEVAVGVPIMPGESEYNQIARMCRLLGPPPAALCTRAKRTVFFLVPSKPTTRRGYGEAAPASLAPYVMRYELAVKQPKLVAYQPLEPLQARMERHLPEAMAAAERGAIIGLVAGLLSWDPKERFGARQALAALRASSAPTLHGCRV